jgi:hypothetical protein
VLYVSFLVQSISGEHVKRLPAAFYQLASGREPVREWLKLLPDEDRKVVGEDIKDVEFSWPIGMPAFIKKTQKTPQAELELALKRRKEIT